MHDFSRHRVPLGLQTEAHLGMLEVRVVAPVALFVVLRCTRHPPLLFLGLLGERSVLLLGADMRFDWKPILDFLLRVVVLHAESRLAHLPVEHFGWIWVPLMFLHINGCPWNGLHFSVRARKIIKLLVSWCGQRGKMKLRLILPA